MWTYTSFEALKVRDFGSNRCNVTAIMKTSASSAEIKKNKKAQPRNRSCASHYYNNAVKADARPKKIPGAFAAASGMSRSGLKSP